jgi:1-acyl-sn-glycerol-3-phosphate acyltransferase
MRPYYSAARSLARASFSVLTGWEVRGSDLLPRRGGLIVASNHISFWDPPLIGAAMPREAHFLAKEELFATPILGPLIRSLNAIPIRRGSADLSGLHRAIEALKHGGSLLLFPEGSRMRDGELHPARPGLGLLAVHADVPIAPCYISGSNRPRRWLVRGARVRIGFGPARDWRELAGPDSDLTPGRALYQRIGGAVMREITMLRTEQQQSASRGAA